MLVTLLPVSIAYSSIALGDIKSFLVNMIHRHWLCTTRSNIWIDNTSSKYDK